MKIIHSSVCSTGTAAVVDIKLQYNLKPVKASPVTFRISRRVDESIGLCSWQLNCIRIIKAIRLQSCLTSIDIIQRQWIIGNSHSRIVGDVMLLLVGSRSIHRRTSQPDPVVSVHRRLSRTSRVAQHRLKGGRSGRDVLAKSHVLLHHVNCHRTELRCIDDACNDENTDGETEGNQQHIHANFQVTHVRVDGTLAAECTATAK